MMYNNTKDKLNGYPSPLATNEEKADIKYGLDNAFLKQIGGEHDRGFESGMEQTVNWFLENREWLQ